jgi:hypothetical protein
MRDRFDNQQAKDSNMYCDIRNKREERAAGRFAEPLAAGLADRSRNPSQCR